MRASAVLYVRQSHVWSEDKNSTSSTTFRIFPTLNEAILKKKLYLCTRNYKTHSVMTETKTKKAFKDWDISDFDFAHAESLADQPLRRNHIPFYGFNKVPKGEHRPQFPKHYPTSNLADVL